MLTRRSLEQVSFRHPFALPALPHRTHRPASVQLCFVGARAHHAHGAAHGVSVGWAASKPALARLAAGCVGLCAHGRTGGLQLSMRQCTKRHLGPVPRRQGRCGGRGGRSVARRRRGGGRQQRQAPWQPHRTGGGRMGCAAGAAAAAVAAGVCARVHPRGIAAPVCGAAGVGSGGRQSSCCPSPEASLDGLEAVSQAPASCRHTGCPAPTHSRWRLPPINSLHQATGDVLRVTTRAGGTVLPAGVDPLPAGDAPGQIARPGGGRRRALSQAAVDFLLPPNRPDQQHLPAQVHAPRASISPAAGTDVSCKIGAQAGLPPWRGVVCMITPFPPHRKPSHSAHSLPPRPQALYRCHGAQVVFVGFLPAAAAMLTVDQRGLAALWPADAGGSGRSGGRAGSLPRPAPAGRRRGQAAPLPRTHAAGCGRADQLRGRRLKWGVRFSPFRLPASPRLWLVQAVQVPPTAAHTVRLPGQVPPAAGRRGRKGGRSWATYPLAVSHSCGSRSRYCRGMHSAPPSARPACLTSCRPHRGVPKRVLPPPPPGALPAPPPIANPLQRVLRRAAAAGAGGGLFWSRGAGAGDPAGRTPYEPEPGEGHAAAAQSGVPGASGRGAGAAAAAAGGGAGAGGAGGGGALEGRVPWLVRYRTEVTGAATDDTPAAVGHQRVLREVIHRPAGDAGAGGGSGGVDGAPAARAGSLVVSSYDGATGQLVARYKQRCGTARAPCKVYRRGAHVCCAAAGCCCELRQALALRAAPWPAVPPRHASLHRLTPPAGMGDPCCRLQVVAAELTPSRRDLVMMCSVPGAADDPDGFATITVLVKPPRAGACRGALPVAPRCASCSVLDGVPQRGRVPVGHSHHCTWAAHRSPFHSPPPCPPSLLSDRQPGGCARAGAAHRRARPLVRRRPARARADRAPACARLRVPAAAARRRHAGRLQPGHCAAGGRDTDGHTAARMGRALPLDRAARRAIRQR